MTRQELYQKYLCDCTVKCTGKVLEQCAAGFFKDLDSVIKGENNASLRRDEKVQETTR